MISLEHSQVENVSTVSEAVDKEEMISILKSIIVTRCRHGATVDEIIGDYKEFTGDNILSIFRDRDSVADVLREIPGVWSLFTQPDGPYLWYCSSENTQHITDMIKKQKSPRLSVRKFQPAVYQPPSTPLGVSNGTGNRDKFFEDNINFIPRRNAWNRMQNQSRSHPYNRPQLQRRQFYQAKTQQRYYSKNYNKNKFIGPDFCGYQMIGDDFFLSLARWELGFKFDPGYIKKSGLCISGLTIAEAADRVLRATYINDRVIVNVGAVDLLHGHDFVDMQQDLIQLIINLEARGAAVILTTISPLANCGHIPGITERLNMFNNLIRRYQWQHIDLWRCFVNEHDHTIYSCFQPEPCHVSGSNQPHVLWNSLGRQRIIKFMKAELAALI